RGPPASAGRADDGARRRRARAAPRRARGPHGAPRHARRGAGEAVRPSAITRGGAPDVSWALVARKDLAVEWRARETLVPTLLVGLVVVAVGLLAFHDVAERRAVAAGTLWLALAFASGVGLARAVGAAKDRGTLDVLL